MNLDEIRKIAGYYKIKVGRQKKSEIVKAMQRAEGNEPCLKAARLCHVVRIAATSAGIASDAARH